MLRQAQHEREGVVLDLVCHTETPSSEVTAVTIEWRADDENEVLLTFIIHGAEKLVIPTPKSPARADELWRTTCVELFWRPVGEERYLEFNFSPSSQWAAYAFAGYRSGMRALPMTIPPHIAVEDDHGDFQVKIDLDLTDIPPGPATIGLSAVIEETDGTRSYWALAHPPGAPDFHHDACFALEVPAVASP